MLFNNSVLTTFVRSIIFTVLAGLSLNAAAYSHDDGEKKAKAKAKVENAMEKKDGMHEGMAGEMKDGEHKGMDDSDLTDAEKELEEEAKGLAPEE